MRRLTALAPVLCLAACVSAPKIDDWPPKPPAVDAATVQKYVDIYAHEEPAAPVYGADDIDALNLLNRRKLRNATPDGDIDKLRKELDDIRAAGVRAEDDEDPRDRYSRNEINAIKRRAERRYDSKHDQRMELKRHGL